MRQIPRQCPPAHVELIEKLFAAIRSQVRVRLDIYSITNPDKLSRVD